MNKQREWYQGPPWLLQAPNEWPSIKSEDIEITETRLHNPSHSNIEQGQHRQHLKRH